MIVKQVRLTAQAKERMSRLKGRTGIRNWNVLARWGFCYSLKEGSVPADVELSFEDGVEMSWETFTGEANDIYENLLIHWCCKNGLPTDAATLSKYFLLHLDRGIGYLTGTNFIRSIEDLLALGFE